MPEATPARRGRPGKLGDLPPGAKRWSVWVSADERAALQRVLKRLRNTKKIQAK